MEMETGSDPVEAFGTAPKQNFTESSFFEISTYNLTDFSAVLE